MDVRKIYINSKYRISGTPSNFTVQLPVTIQVPDNTAAVITECTCPAVWGTVIDDLNNVFYFVQSDDVNGLNADRRMFLVPSKSYSGTSLAEELQTKLNDTFTGYTVTYDFDTNKISITHDTKYFKITYSQQETVNEFVNLVSSFTINTNLYSFNEHILQNSSNGYTQLYKSGFILLTSHIHNIYLSSDNLSSFNTLDLLGRRSIIKKVPVNVGYGGLIIENSHSSVDFIDVSRKNFNTLNFRLTDSDNNEIPLNNTNVSFSILFTPLPQ